MRNKRKAKIIDIFITILLLFITIGTIVVFIYNGVESKKELENKAKLEATEQEAQQPEHYVPEPYTPAELYGADMWDDKYTLYEVQLLASCVYAEGGSESDEMQQGVAAVILNRVASPNYPNTIEEVIYQNKPLQYACTVNGALNRYKGIYVGKDDYKDSDWESLERCLENTETVLANGSEFPANVVYQAEFKQGNGVYKQVGTTYFCYE